MTSQDTSLLAYAALVMPTLGRRQWDVVCALQRLTEASNAEIARYLGWPINTVTPRVGELRKIGLVEDAGKRICGVTGSTVHVWKLKEEIKINGK